MSNFNLVVYNNLSLYRTLKELNDFFSYKLHFHIDNIENLDKFLKDNPKTLVISNKKLDNAINHLTIIKPIKINLLLEKISINLSKSNFRAQSKFSLGEYFLDINSRFLVKNNEKLKLTQKEVELIYFLKNSKLEKSPEILQKEIWKHSDGVETHTVETHIYRLRKKINDKFKNNNFIINNKKGYKLVN